MTTPEDALVLVTGLGSEAVDWTVADYRSNHADFLDVHWFKAMFRDGCNAFIYNRRGLKRDTDIAGWNRRWNLMHSCCPGCIDPIGFLDMPLVRRGD